MPSTALKHLAKKAGKKLSTAEHDWEKAKSIVKKEYGKTEDDPAFWALTTGVTKKMLGLKEMTTFKKFLEAAVGPAPTFTQLDVEAAIDMLRTHCKNALWMLDENKPIYRGESYFVGVLEHGFATVDTTATKRESENTTNYYTEILDNTPSRAHFPKRSRSFIASFSKGRAEDFARADWDAAPGTIYNKSVYVIVPFDDTLIGCVNKADMWDTMVSVYGEKTTINDMNHKYNHAQIDPRWEDFVETNEQIKAKDGAKLRRMQTAFRGFDESLDFLEVLDNAYSPQATGHTVHTTANLPHDTEGEVWIGGKCVIISIPMWKKLRDAFTD